MRTGRAAWAAGVAAALLALAGCGDPATGEVTGSVSYDGQPVEDGAITFLPADGKGPTAGGTIKAGKYTATKVAPGTAKVVISQSKVVGKKKVYDTPNSPEMPVTKEALPEKYSSQQKTELTFEVKPGKNEKDWNLAK